MAWIKERFTDEGVKRFVACYRDPETLTPAEYDAILAALPEQHRLMIETAINTGLRWGELIALKPRHLNFSNRTLTVGVWFPPLTGLSRTATGWHRRPEADGLRSAAGYELGVRLLHPGRRARHDAANTAPPAAS